MEPWTPATRNMDGDVSYYDPRRIAKVRGRLKGVNKKQYLNDVVARVLHGATTDKERVARICGFVHDAIYYNPIKQPVVDAKGEVLITDPVELLELHDGRCGQDVEITHTLLQTAGIESR